MSARTSVEYEPNQHEQQHQRNFSISSYGSDNDEKAVDSAISTIPPTPSGMLTPNGAFSSSTSTLTPYFRSRRKRPEEVSRPWAQTKKDKALGSVWHWLLPIVTMTLGIAGAGVRVYFAAQQFPQMDYCSVLMEDFASGSLDPAVWTQEVEVGGYGSVNEKSRRLEQKD